MKKTRLLLLIFLLAGYCYSQDVTIIKQAAIKLPRQDNYSQLSFIHSTIDTAGLTFVAKIMATGIDKYSTIDRLYKKIKLKAKALGANSFTFCDYKRNDTTLTAQLTLNFYLAQDTSIQRNYIVQEQNTIYIFTPETIPISINDSIKSNVAPGNYCRHVLKNGETVTIKIVGESGHPFSLTWKRMQPAYFIQAVGSGYEGYASYIGNTLEVGVQTNPDQFKWIDDDLGRIMVLIFKQNND